MPSALTLRSLHPAQLPPCGAVLGCAGAWIRALSPLCSMLTGGWMLRLPRVRAQDGGHYSCLASNTAGEARREFQVEVLGKGGTSTL